MKGEVVETPLLTPSTKYSALWIVPKVSRSGPTVIVPATVVPAVSPVSAGVTDIWLFTMKVVLTSRISPEVSVITIRIVWDAFVSVLVL